MKTFTHTRNRTGTRTGIQITTHEKPKDMDNSRHKADDKWKKNDGYA